MNSDIYKDYCQHGNPIYYSGCPHCHFEKQQKDNINYKKYLKKISFNFKKYFNKQYDYYFVDPSLQTENVIKPRKDDKFIKLKKSNSQEELKREYYKLAKHYHPDKPTGSTHLFQKLTQIYNLLKSTLPDMI